MRLSPFQLFGITLVTSAGVLIYRAHRNQNPLDVGSSMISDIVGTILNLTGANMKTSAAGLAFITAKEGRVNVVYADEGGLPTGGIGHLITASDGLSIGDEISDADIDAFFASDISHAENIVARYVTVPLNQNQWDAIVSATFNLGDHLFKNRPDANGVRTDTHFLQALNTGNYAGAAEHMLDFSRLANGLRSQGLYARRESEHDLFLA